MLKRSNFQGTLKGNAVDLFTLSNKNGLKASITNYGARLVELLVPDREGKRDNIVVGYSSMEAFMNNEEAYFGAVIGRYANRIAKGSFRLGDKEYQLEANEEANHLHGGSKGFHQVVWGANQVSDQKLTLSYRSVDGEGGYPGNLGVSVTYELTDEDELHISFQAESDAKTILNMTHHAYYNLQGSQTGATVYDHDLMINADEFTPVKESLIPTGEFAPVENTPFDFRSAKSIGQDREEDHLQLTYGNGYDHNFILNKKKVGEMSHAASVVDSQTGRTLDLYTTEPGLQFYECRHPVEEVDSSFCLEPQHFPDSPNQDQFPSVVLEAYTPYTSETVLAFKADKQIKD